MNNRTNKLLTAVVVLQSLTLAGQWFNPSYTPSAQAQVPDGGAQRLQQLEQLRDISAKLDRVAGILEGGKLQVRVVRDDKADGK
ncbi:hypothetical protein BH09PLA1_BH09PLA1_30710 [soil metagenome]